ncbi:MAG: DUF2069 domain-containing protein [Gammaproteobacteria bacterium]
MSIRLSGRALVLAALVLLVLWLFPWLGWLTEARPAQRITWLVLALAPLAVTGFFVSRDSVGGFAWSGFLSLAYFAQGVTVVLTSRSDAGFAAVEIFLSLLLFSAAGAALRLRRRMLG